ncbi:MAG: ECF transporter S component [Oscillospiraceae bacterium]|nr:ECF transporter S component [Oscillospiraceae bacterium]
MNSTKKLVTSSLLLAVALLLPFVTGQIPEIGNMLLPMHLPVLLAGFIVGGPSAMAIGAIAPLLRSVLWGMPVLFPKAISMAFELAAYGLVSGIVYSNSKKDGKSVFISLITAMIAGRVVWGIVSMILFGVMGKGFTMALFMTEAFVNAVPGIAVQFIAIPMIVSALKRSNSI